MFNSLVKWMTVVVLLAICGAMLLLRWAAMIWG
ncbi:small membrane protein YniD [Escherichia sp. SP-MK2]